MLTIIKSSTVVVLKNAAGLWPVHKRLKLLIYSALQKNSFFADFGKSGIAMFVIKTEKL